MTKPFKNLLKENLDLSKKNESPLPSSYQKIGNIVIINLKDDLEKYSKKIGKTVLENIPHTKTVCKRTKFITGKFRKPNIEVIAGDKNTETIHKEHGIKYKLDVAKVMFSKGNLNERQRLTDQVSENETIVDMFAGIGYFSLGLAKNSDAEKIYAIELNPVSYHYLWENIKLNEVQGKLVPIFGDCKKECEGLSNANVNADRIIMGLLPSPKDYLDSAMKIIKTEGIIHYHSTLGVDEPKEGLLFEINNVAMKCG